jgi:peptidoglycan/LPS O-acetylase OafA/YrhL
MQDRPARMSGSRYDSLDIWRGVACLLVLVNHAVQYELTPQSSAPSLAQLYAGMAAVAARLWIGVPIFFVISGYCITAAADSHRRKGVPLSTYFLRRFRRIFPPYWVVLGTTAVIIGVGDVWLGSGLTRNSGFLRPWWYSPAQWFGSISLTEIWRPHLFGGQKALFLGHAWTLCYEEQFYAVCGLLLLLCPRRFFLGALAVTAAVGLIAMGAASRAVPIDGFFFDGGWIEFALGIQLYYALNYAGVVGRRLAAVTFFVVLAVAASYGTALLEWDKNRPQEFLVAGGFALAALLLRRFDSRMMNSALLQPIRTCGIMCYSLYLVHLPVVNLTRAALHASGVATSTLSPFIALPLYGTPALWIAWQFHVFVERRFMNSPISTAPRLEPTPLVAVVTSQ